jgi:group I intron endonuclease
MRILKSNPVLTLLNSYMVDSPQPSTISYLWNFGSLLGLSLIAQIVTGILVSMHYAGTADLAFNSVEHIMRDVNDGWLLRYAHANMASFFFIAVYLHISRGLYYGSYKTPRIGVWVIGTIIFILMMATAFLGYDFSPKWFIFNNLNCHLLYFLSYFIILLILCLIQEYKYIKENKKIKIKYKVQNKVGLFSYSLNPEFRHFNKYSGLRKYSTKSIINDDENTMSSKLNDIIKELGINPVLIYENLNLEIIRKQILNETKGLSGIYMIINKITDDYYIGSASTNRFFSRFSNHLIYYRGSKIVKLAVKKYNLENFAFIILELYPNVVTKENNKELLDLEDKYLKLLLPNYNILTEAGSSFGYKHTELDRLKMRDIYTDDRRERIGNLNKGKNLSEETRNKLREIAFNRPPMSEETKKKCIRNIRPVTLYNLNGTVYGKYMTIMDAAKAINCHDKTIRRALKTKKRLVKKQWIVKDSNLS